MLTYVYINMHTNVGLVTLVIEIMIDSFFVVTYLMFYHTDLFILTDIKSVTRKINAICHCGITVSLCKVCNVYKIHIFILCGMCL